MSSLGKEILEIDPSISIYNGSIVSSLVLRSSPLLM